MAAQVKCITLSARDLAELLGRSADLILVMKDGKVIEQGTHDALMQ